MLKQIINGRILTPQGWLEGGSVIIDGNKILAVSNSDLHIVNAQIIDAKGCYVVPGGVDLHVHGGGGRDFMEGTGGVPCSHKSTHEARHNLYIPNPLVFYRAND